jgi:alpha-aminoadipic semialdehyde synthase
MILMGIRREEKNIWEGRTPLTPSDASFLMSTCNVKICIQPSQIRVFNDEEYKQKGVKVSEDLSECNIILGVKEMPPKFIQKEKIYLFFSHTIKGQKENLPTLRKIIENHSTLIDYERITTHLGERIIGFGKYAGIVGMVEGLWGLGERLRSEGKKVGFLQVKRTLQYKRLNKIKDGMKKVKEGEFDSPYIFGILGGGSCSKGAIEVIRWAGGKEIKVEEIDKIKVPGVYWVKFGKKERYKRKGGEEVNVEEYVEKPHLYESNLMKYLPYLVGIVNCVYWEERFPRLITNEMLKELYPTNKKFKIISDISCDVNGGIECLIKTTDPGEPIFTYEPLTGKIEDGIYPYGIQVVGVDNLPCLLSYEASIEFSKKLVSILSNILKSNFGVKFEKWNLSPEIKQGVIVYKGELTPMYEYLKEVL